MGESVAAGARRAWHEGRPWLWLDRRHDGEGWRSGSFVVDAPRLSLEWYRAEGGSAAAALDHLDRLHRQRRGGNGGLLLLIGYDALTGDVAGLPSRARAAAPGDAAPIPEIALFECDAAQRPGTIDDELEQIKPLHPPRTSLLRDEHIAAVARAQSHIARGDIYQVNVCQQFRVALRAAPIDLYAGLADSQRPPFGALVQGNGWAVASLSPERFLYVDRDGDVVTEPVKGTRRRGLTQAEDRAAAAALRASEKDRAELLMIVDLERNDLGRICRPGSIRVERLHELRSYPAVHHLVGTIRGRLNAGWRPSELLRATFPGGSITGAPKRRAMEIIAALEPATRNAFTGSLVWFDDDGSIDSSILIRTVVFHPDEQVTLGAGGGIVADSDPLAEWEESNTKVRPLCRALGFAPESVSLPRGQLR